jgi:GNAT superfamily N-acetyltransferase
MAGSAALQPYIIRQFDASQRERDKAAMFAVCLRTGDSGDDASGKFTADPNALGRRWVGPYLALEPEFALVLEASDRSAVYGYALGCLDTDSFVARLTSSYLPQLLTDPRFAKEAFLHKPRTEWSAAEAIYHEYHDTPDAPAFVVAKYPSHLHVDLTVEAQGAGNGRRMMGALLSRLRLAGSRGVHLEMHSSNARGRRFYERLGFHEVARVLDVFDAASLTSKRHILSGEGYGLFLPPRPQPPRAAAAASAATVVPSLEDVLRDGTPHIVYMAMVFRPRGEPTDWRPAPVYGRRLLKGGDVDEGVIDMSACKANAIVLTAPEPWDIVKHQFTTGGTQPGSPPLPLPPGVHHVTSMDHDRALATTEVLVREVHAKGMGRVSAVFGIGGGSACDHAKFVVEKVNAMYEQEVKSTTTSIANDGDTSSGGGATLAPLPLVPLVLMPTILSVDAPYTRAAGVRETGKVRYVGNARPFLEGGGALLVDYDLLQAAPPALNRAGVGDLLSIFTALRDWRQAALRQGEGYDDDIAAKAARTLGRLVEGADEIRNNSEAGLRLLSEL